MDVVISFLEKLLHSGAPWWVVVGLILFVVVAGLLVIFLAPNVARRFLHGKGPTQSQRVIINVSPGRADQFHQQAFGRDNPFHRLSRNRSGRPGMTECQLAEELDLLKSDGDEVHVYEVAPEKE